MREDDDLKRATELSLQGMEKEKETPGLAVDTCTGFWLWNGCCLHVPLNRLRGVPVSKKCHWIFQVLVTQKSSALWSFISLQTGVKKIY